MPTQALGVGVATTKTGLTILIGEEARVAPLKETIMANKGTEILSTRVRIGKIDSREIKVDKVGATITGIMIIKASVEEAGVVIIITEANRIFTGVEAVVGINHKIMIRSVNHIGSMVTIASTPSHNNIMTSNPDQRNHNKQPRYVSGVTIKDILTINANLQVILFLECNKPLIKVGNIITRMHKVNGRRGIMIMKTPMISLFSRGGSRCC